MISSQKTTNEILTTIPLLSHILDLAYITCFERGRVDRSPAQPGNTSEGYDYEVAWLTSPKNANHKDVLSNGRLVTILLLWKVRTCLLIYQVLSAWELAGPRNPPLPLPSNFHQDRAFSYARSLTGQNNSMKVDRLEDVEHAICWLLPTPSTQNQDIKP